jgi:hypothetical protein
MVRIGAMKDEEAQEILRRLAMKEDVESDDLIIAMLWRMAMMQKREDEIVKVLQSFMDTVDTSFEQMASKMNAMSEIVAQAIVRAMGEDYAQAAKNGKDMVGEEMSN